MKRKQHSNRRFSIGQLVDVAYQEAARITPNRKLAAVIASRLLEEMLSASDRPDMVARLQTAHL